MIALIQSQPNISHEPAQKMVLKIEEARDNVLKKIDETLKQLDEHEYGFCESCGIEIGLRRLEARPTATLCIDCKTLDEIREKQMA